MFILRSVNQADIDALYDLSGRVLFINLPHDKKIIKRKVESSINSFKNPSPDFSKNYYIFVLEDLSNNSIAGVSMIHAKHGTEKEPHFYLKVDHEHKYSQTINTGFMHGTLKLGLETDGYSEIGGLVLHPDYRGHKDKLGKQLSFVRFLYMGMHPDQFTKVIHSELMPPLDSEGHSPLWEAIGRRFMNMEYPEADLLSRTNKEFILSLFPSEVIYLTLLPIEARNAIGKVGSDTLPVKKMLENVGFRYMNEIDPFDGGPHYRCKLEEIKPIKNMINVRLIKASSFASEKANEYLLSISTKEHTFFSIKVLGNLDSEHLSVSDETWSLLENYEIESLEAKAILLN